MGNYTPNLFMTQLIYDPTHSFATPNKDPSPKSCKICCGTTLDPGD